jgi:1,4-alpha-glucan branching enzyme
MKKNKPNNPRQHDGQPSWKSVRIEFIHAKATTISIIGTFNRWQIGAAPMTRVGEDRWFTELVLPPGVYEYQFLVDGQWMPDPRTDKTPPNPFGEVNSVLKVDPGDTP